MGCTCARHKCELAKLLPETDAHDVHLAIRDWFEKSHHSQDAECAKLIGDKAEGIFQYAQFAFSVYVELVEEDLSQLQRVAIVREFPRGLHGLYSSYVSRALKRQEDGVAEQCTLLIKIIMAFQVSRRHRHHSQSSLATLTQWRRPFVVVLALLSSVVLMFAVTRSVNVAQVSRLPKKLLITVLSGPDSNASLRKKANCALEALQSLFELSATGSFVSPRS